MPIKLASLVSQLSFFASHCIYDAQAVLNIDLTTEIVL